MKKKITSIFLIFFIIILNTFAYAEVRKDETVYVRLLNNGEAEEIKVVNHIYGYENSNFYTDYGSYSQVINMNDNTKPSINNGEITWPMDVLRSRDLYYEGTIKKELPIGVNIKYYLDDREISPIDIGGKTGHLKIEINISYNKNIDWEKAGLITQIQLTPDLEVFKNIETKGNKVVIGKKATITFVSFPSSSQSFTVEMDGGNIYLDPINISLVPSSFELPEDIKNGLDGLMDGVNKMDEGSGKLIEGSDSLISGTGELKNGMTELDKGASKLYLGSSQLSKSSRELSQGMEELHKGINEMGSQGGKLVEGIGQLRGGMEELALRSSEIYGGIGELNGGLKGINAGTKELSKGLDELNNGHTQLMQLAYMYINSEDPLLRQMAQGIIQEGEALNTLNTGLKETSNGIDKVEKSCGQLYTGFGEYKNGVDKISGSMKEMSLGAEKLPEALKKLCIGFGSVKDGTNKYFFGVEGLSNGLYMMKENTKILPGSIDKLSGGQAELRKGIVSLNSGINKMNKELDENINSTLLGKVESTYKSFADNERNENSTIQFIMRTEGIKRSEVKKEYSEKVEKKGFWDRVVDLFRRK